MKNYNGTASFDYEVERYKDKKTGKYITLDEVESLARHQENEDWVDENYQYLIVQWLCQNPFKLSSSSTISKYSSINWDGKSEYVLRKFFIPYILSQNKIFVLRTKN